MQAVISAAEAYTDIIVLSQEEAYNNSQLSNKIDANIIIRSAASNASFNIGLYSNSGRDLIAYPSSVKTNSFISGLPGAASNIAEYLRESYKPKPVKYLTNFTKKVISSQMEHDKPDYQVNLIPMLDYISMDYTVNVAGDRVSYQSVYNWAMKLDAYFSYYWMNAEASACVSPGDDNIINTYLGAGAGFFGNTFVLGADLYYISVNDKSFTNDENEFVYGSTNNNIPYPALSYSLFTFGPWLRFNITKDMNFIIHAAFPLLNSVTLSYQSDSSYSLSSDYSLDQNYSASIPYFSTEFNWKINGNVNLVMYYSMLDMELSGGETGMVISSVIPTYISDLHYKVNSFGLGAGYEF